MSKKNIFLGALLAALVFAAGCSVSVTPLTCNSEGTPSAPRAISFFPTTGYVDSGCDSYYSTSVFAGETAVTIYSQTGDGDLKIYSDSGFSNLIDSSSNYGTAADTAYFSCNGTCPLYIKTYGYSTSYYAMDVY